jgi:hypothetical protein
MQTESSSDRTIAVVACKPRPGKGPDLLQLTACRAKDGTVVEVLEWAAGGVGRATPAPQS